MMEQEGFSPQQHARAGLGSPSSPRQHGTLLRTQPDSRQERDPSGERRQEDLLSVGHGPGGRAGASSTCAALRQAAAPAATPALCLFIE